MFGDIAKTFGRNFLIAHLTPAALFVIANVILMVAGFLVKPEPKYWVAFGLPKPVMLLIVIAFLALGLRQLNIPIIRLYEGYYGRNWFPLLKFFENRRKREYRKIKKQIEQMKEEDPAGLMEEYKLSRSYPPYEEAILPTKLGNLIKAFEYYVHEIYNIDPITSWQRLVAVIPQSHREQIGEAETNFSFVLNLSLISAVLGIECLALWAGLWSGPAKSASVTLPIYPSKIPSVSTIALVFFLLAYIFYRGSFGLASLWGEYVRSAFDLYRYDLLKQMGIFLPSEPITLKEEREKIWGPVQMPTFYAKDPGDKLKFLPRSLESAQGKRGEKEETSIQLKRLAEEFSMTEEELARESLRAFLLDKLHLLDSDRKARCAKFGVTSLEEMDELIKRGVVEEKAILEDFQTVDYLTSRIERIHQLLKEL